MSLETLRPTDLHTVRGDIHGVMCDGMLVVGDWQLEVEADERRASVTTLGAEVLQLGGVALADPDL